MIVTPEAVVLDLDTAGLGSRFAAAVLDALIYGSTAAVLMISGLILVDSFWVFIAVFAVTAFVPIAYGAIFETLWNGRTPGKKANKLRVVQTNGHPINWKHAVVRNLFRLVDNAVGVLFVLFTKRSQRLGDLAAGTIVVREPSGAAPQPFALTSDPMQQALARRIDASGIGTREYGMLRDFLRRREHLDDAGRRSVARQLAEIVRARVPFPLDEPIPDELLIEAAVVAVQSRPGGPATGASSPDARDAGDAGEA
jgi:uncharacterized RDD family membrane protein YckC